MQYQVNSLSGIEYKMLLPFMLMTFSMTWGLSALLLFFPDIIVDIFGEITASNPVFMLAVYSPGIAGVILIWRHSGLASLTLFFRRLTLWRMPVTWWLFLTLAIPAIFYLGAMFKGSIGDPFPFSSWSQLIPALLFAFFLGPVEEFGWRGVALPLLQRKFVPFWAGLILGFIWAVWHIPAFLMSGAPQSGWSYSAFFVGVIAISIILTPMFNRSGGSLLIPYLYHFQMMNPIWPDAQPYDTGIFVLVAVITVWINRTSMFAFDGAIEEVVPVWKG